MSEVKSVIRKQTKVWTTKDGKRVRVCDMTDSHLLNTINLIERNYRKCCLAWSAQALSYAFSEMTPDGASCAAEQEGDAFLSHSETLEGIEDECPIYESLIQERQRRELCPKP